MFSCSLLTLIASSLLSHTSIRSLAVHRSLIMLRVFSPSFFIPCVFSSNSINDVFDYIMRLITLNMHTYPTLTLPLFISVSQSYGACFVLNVRYPTSTYKHVHEQYYQWIWNTNNFLIIIYEAFALERFPFFMRFHVLSCKFTQIWSRNHLIYIYTYVSRWTFEEYTCW